MSFLSRLLFGILGFSLLAQCNTQPEVQIPIEAKFQAFCGSCHSVPDPKDITKDLWTKKVLPEMAARMGYKVDNYNPKAGKSREEVFYMNRSKIYPESSTFDSITWRQIHEYIINLAPDSIPIERERADRNSALTQFHSSSFQLGDQEDPRVCFVQYESETNQFLIGDTYGNSYSWPDPSVYQWQFNSPLISYNKSGNDIFFTEIGYLNPSEIPLGLLIRESNGITDTLASKIHRPVFTEIVDLNEDGEMEILICEFGHLTGELSILTKNDSSYEKSTLLPFPGTINIEIQDMNKDGKKDIVVLASQGNEGLFILYQTDDLKFRSKQVIKMSSVYGSSWFVTLDYDKDGDLDVAYVNGDNADLSIISKPYHGLRLFLNDGKDNFSESWFYPIYGATRILAEDFDLDGDPDFAVMSFFPDFEAAPEEGFVYLENIDPLNYQFKSYTLRGHPAGRWLVMDKGDPDNDGDMDIMLGSYAAPPESGSLTILDYWIEEKVDILYLENKALDTQSKIVN
jgi:hypothetical protein